MRTKCVQLLMVSMLIVAIGGHWALLQSVAWVGMLANNARECSLTEAIEKTFDGNHPCALCKIVAAGKKAEKKQSIVKTDTKLDLWLNSSGFLLAAPRPAWYPRVEAEVFQSRFESPPTPPPRPLSLA